MRPPHRGLSVKQAPENTVGQIAPRLKLCAESAGCRSVEVVAVVRTVRELQRALTILENWTKTSTASGPSAAPEPDSAARREIARIEQAIRAKDERVLEEYGDLQACLKRIVELNDLHRSSTPGTLIHGFATWRSRRLPGGGF